jgi:cation:H+ antiporter
LTQIKVEHYLALAGGIACAALGGELFVRSAVGLGRAMRVSASVVGATIAAFATSSPELSVAVNAALERRPQIALGDALGSNVVNVALVLGIALLIGPVRSPPESVRRELPVALAVPVLTALLALDGTLSRIDGLVLFAAFTAWLAAVLRQARRERRAADGVRAPSARVPLLQGVAGLLLLFLAGRLIVDGAAGIAGSFGVSHFVIGATIVAIGTSAPELATAVVAKLRGHDDVSLGMLLGSNIFNGLWIVGVAAVVFPIAVEWGQVALALGFGVVVMTAAIPLRHGLLGRGRGMLLVALYASYVGAVLLL